MAILAFLSFINILALPIVLIIAFRLKILWLPLPFILLQLAWIFSEGPDNLAYQMTGAFGVGMMLLLLPAFLLLLALIILLVECVIAIYRVIRRKQQATWLAMYIMTGIASLFLLAYPLNVALGFIERCGERNDQAAFTIIDALNRYKTNEGKYPQTLDILVPDYLSAIPKSHCLERLVEQQGTRKSDSSVVEDVDLPKFEICRGKVTIPSVVDAFVQMYDLKTKEAHSVSFLDDPECYDKSFRK